MAEHAVIEDMLEITRTAARDLAQDGDVGMDLDILEQAVDFFRNFADKCHHGKEERHLFERLAERGMPKQGGPVGVMLAEHEQGRSHIRGMAEALGRIKDDRERDGSLDRGAVNDLVGHALSYCDLLSAHIRKENDILFPMADQLLSPEDQEELEEAFERVETEEMGEDVHEKYHHMVHELSDKLTSHRAH
jgi:hemerythrin-like domain-containing protein